MLQVVYMLSKDLRFIKSFLLLFTLTALLFVFSLLALLQNACSNTTSKWNKFKQQTEIAFTLPGNVGNHVLAVEKGVWETSKIMDEEISYIALVGWNGEIIDSTHYPYISGGGVPENGVAAFEVGGEKLIVFGSDNTIYVKTDDGQIIDHKTFDLQGQVWTAPTLCPKNDKELYIIIPTLREYIEGGQSFHDTYVYVFVYNTETKKIDFASANQPIFETQKAFLGRDGLAVGHDEDGRIMLFIPITHAGDELKSKLYTVGINGDPLWIGDQGLTMTTGPAVAQKEDGLEVSAGTHADFYADTDTIPSRWIYFFNQDGTQLWPPFHRPGTLPSAGPIYTEANGDRHPERIFTFTDVNDVTLYILDGKTNELLSERYLGNFTVPQIITVDKEVDGCKELLYRTARYFIGEDNNLHIENKVVILHLDEEGRINSFEEVFLQPDIAYRSQGPLSFIEVDGRWILMVGARISIEFGDTHVYFIDLGHVSIEGTWYMYKRDGQRTSYLPLPQKPAPVPEEELLGQNYPNPFSPSTTIEFTLREPSHVEIKIFNILGQKVYTLVKRNLPKGKHRVVWDGRNDKGEKVASGVYFYRISTSQPKQTRAKRMLLLNAIFMFMPLFA